MGCSTTHKSVKPSVNSSLLEQEQVAQRSEAIHGFLVGSLYAGHGQFAEAVRYFDKTASNLGDDVSPFFSQRLAELFLVAGDASSSLDYATRALNKLSDLQKRVSETASDDKRAFQIRVARRELLLLQAGLLSSMGRDDESIAVYTTLQQEYPYDFDSLYLAFDYYVRKNDLGSIKPLLSKYVASNKKDFLGFFLLGIHGEISGDYKSAVKALKTARKLQPESPSVGLALARTYLRLEDFAKARQTYGSLLELSPEDPTLKNLYIALGEKDLDPRLIAAMLENTEMWESDEIESRYFLAELLLKKGDLRRATHELYLLLMLDPDFAKARYRLASVFASLGARDDAVRELEKIDSASPLFVKSRVFATVLQRQLNNDEAAERLLKDALKAEKNNLQILLYLIDILKDAGRFSEAETVVKKALETHPQSSQLIYDYAMLLHVMKRDKEASSLMWRLLEVEPNHHPALNYLAYTMVEDGKSLDKAYEMSKKAVASQPENGYYLDTLGWIEYQRGNYDQAISILEQAAARAPHDGVIVEHLARTLEKTGRMDLARETFEKALAAYEKERDSGTLDDLEALNRVAEKLKKLDSATR